MPSIDVVIPSYNYGHYLSDSIDSVLTQGIENLRILVIDNASTDNSVEIARGFAAKDPRIQVRVHEKNLGPHASFNQAVDWAQQDYFLILCADDLITQASLSRAVTILEAREEVVFAYGMECAWDNTKPLPNLPNAANDVSHRIVDGEQFIESLSMPRTPIGTGSVVVRTSIQKRAGYFRPELYYTDDLEMLMRLASLGPVAEIDAVQGIRRRHGENISSAYRGNWKHELETVLAAFESFFVHEGMSITWAPQLQRRMRRNIAHRAYWAGVAHWLRGFGQEGKDLLQFANILEPSTRLAPPITYWLRVDNARDLVAQRVRELIYLHSKSIRSVFFPRSNS
jgi:glycosyltransferase involved in cell wall biosynthesis